MSQAALSTPLAQGQLPEILYPPSASSTFGDGVYETASRLSGSSQTSCCASSGQKAPHPPKPTRQRAAPAGASASATKLEADLRKLRGAVLVPAEALGLHRT